MSAGKDRHEVLDLTKRLVQDFFAKNDTSLFLRLAADDILWLGGGSTMLADGRDAVQEFYRQGLVGMRPCRLFREDYRTRQTGPDTWLCQAIARVEADPQYIAPAGSVQRGTFVYRRTPQPKADGWHWEIVYLHWSNGRDGAAFGDFCGLNRRETDEVPDVVKSDVYRVLKQHLEALPEASREALTCLSLFDEFTMEQVRFCCGRLVPDLEAFKKTCSDMPYLLFEFQSDAFRFHPILRQYVRNLFADYPMETQIQWRRQAARWYLNAGDGERAFELALSLQDWDLVLAVVEKGKLDVLRGYKPDEAARIVSRVPFETRDCHLKGTLLLMLYVLLRAEPQEADELWESFVMGLPDMYEAPDLARLGYWVLKGISKVPDLETMLPCFKKAKDIARQTGCRLPHEFLSGVTRAVGKQLNLYYRGIGQLQHNRDLLKSVYECCGAAIDDVDTQAWKDLADGEYAYLTGQLDAAEQLLAPCLQDCLGTADKRERAVIAYFLLPRIYLLKKDKEAYLACFAVYEKLKQVITSPMWLVGLTMIASTVDGLTQKSPEQASRKLDELLALPHFPAQEPMRRTARHRLLLTLKRYQTLVFAGVLQQPLPDNPTYTSLMNCFNDNLYLAVAERNTGHPKKALDRIRFLLESCRQDHVITPFVEHSEDIRYCLRRLEHDESVQALVADIQQFEYRKADFSPKGGAALTPREKTIVACMRQGMTNKDIAAKLVLAEVTVKKCEGNIYKKFGVHNRAALIYKLKEE